MGLTKTVAKEWGHLNVRCNAIAYGWIDTRLTRAKEGGEAIVVDGEKVRGVAFQVWLESREHWLGEGTSQGTKRLHCAVCGTSSSSSRRQQRCCCYAVCLYR